MPYEIKGKRAESPPAAGAVVEATAVNDVPSTCPAVSDSGSGSSPPCSPGKEGSGRSEPAQATHPAVERLGGPLCPAPASNRGAGTSAHPLPTAASEAGGCDVDRHRQPGRTAPPHTPDETTGRPEGVVLDKYTLLRLETQLKKELIALNDDEQAAVVKVYSKHAH